MIDVHNPYALKLDPITPIRGQVPMRLVIVESPAKCKKIAGFLGSGYQVVATMGHIRALEPDLEAIGLAKDFELRYRFLPEKSKATKSLLAAAAGAEEIILAADDDREGEAIAYSVACLLKRSPESFPRAVFHEITETAIRNAVAAALAGRRIDMNRVHAQQARAVLDMMVGFTLSPLLWKHVAYGLSAGRCQTPALRLVSEREASIKGHTLQTTWELQGTFYTKKGASFKAVMVDELEDQESAMNYLENVHGDEKAVITANQQRPWSAAPPKPLMTSTLQQEASALYRLTPKATMSIAQALYEAGHITYMRTDHATMCDEAVQSARDWVVKEPTLGEEYLGQLTQAKPKAKEAKAQESKEAKTQPQEAHECIRPTHLEVRDLPREESWTAHDRKVYTLISQRAIQSVMAPARGKTATVTLTLVADETPFPWAATWRKTEFAGWKKLGETAKLDDEESPEETAATAWAAAIALTTGTELTWRTLQAVPKRTRAAPRFTEATLIRELEHKGIGRPSTYASLVETLMDKAYVEKQDIAGQTLTHTTMTITPSNWPPTTLLTQVSQGAEKQKLVPTPLGESALRFCLAHFAHLFAYDFTAQLEQRLDLVATGTETWKDVCRSTWDSYKADYTRLHDKASAPTASDKSRDFGNGLKAVRSAKGIFIVKEGSTKASKAEFVPIPPSLDFKTITPDEALALFKTHQEGTVLATIDGTSVFQKSGKFGAYVQWGSIRIPLIPEDTPQTLEVKLRAKATTDATKVCIGEYTFAKGAYGAYMYKTALQKKEFVKVPEGIDPKKLTVTEAAALYIQGKGSKGQKGPKGPSGRGRGRGRGRGS